MSRRGFLKTAGIAAAGVAAGAMGLGGVAKAQPFPEGFDNPDPDNIKDDGDSGWIITPVGDPAPVDLNPITYGILTQDSCNIQWAALTVAPGKKITLSHLDKDGNEIDFEFSDYYPDFALPFFNVWLGVNTGFTITGEEVDAEGKPKTKIRNGVALFNLTTPPDSVPIILKDLIFENPKGHVAGVMDKYDYFSEEYEFPRVPREVTIENCTVNDMDHIPNNIVILDFFGLGQVFYYTNTSAFFSYQQAGSYTVKGCTINIPNENPPWIRTASEFSPASAQACIGILFFPQYLGEGPKETEVKIEGNILHINCSIYDYSGYNPKPLFPDGNTGILLEYNIGSTTISGNELDCRSIGMQILECQNVDVFGNTFSFPSALNQVYPNLPKGITPDLTQNYAIQLLGACINNNFYDNDASKFNATSPASVFSQVYVSGLSEHNYFGPNNPGITPEEHYKDDLDILPENEFGGGYIGFFIEGSNDYFIGNTLNGPYGQGILLCYSEATNSTAFNQILNNTVMRADEGYAVHDSVWFLNNAGKLRINHLLYPHLTNNEIHAESGDTRLFLKNIDDYHLLEVGGNTTNLDIQLPPDYAPQNPHSKVQAQGPKPMIFIKEICLNHGGTWDPLNKRCILPQP